MVSLILKFIYFILSDSRGGITPDEPIREGSSSVRKKDDTYQTIRIKHAFKRDSTLVLEWEPTRETFLGYQVMKHLYNRL